jgi:hypothetical protein
MGAEVNGNLVHRPEEKVVKLSQEKEPAAGDS